jgi:hypothetical protein
VLCIYYPRLIRFCFNAVKEELPNDLERVDMLFQDAVEAGIDIQVRFTISIVSPMYNSKKLLDCHCLEPKN